MTAMPTDRHVQLNEDAIDAVVPLLHAVACMTRARDRIGTRSFAYDLLDVAAAIEVALPAVRLELRGRHGGEMPLRLRVELSILWRAATRSDELGSAGASVVPPSQEHTELIRCDLEAWLRCAEGLVLELDRSAALAA